MCTATVRPAQSTLDVANVRLVNNRQLLMMVPVNYASVPLLDQAKEFDAQLNVVWALDWFIKNYPVPSWEYKLKEELEKYFESHYSSDGYTAACEIISEIPGNQFLILPVELVVKFSTVCNHGQDHPDVQGLLDPLKSEKHDVFVCMLHMARILCTHPAQLFSFEELAAEVHHQSGCTYAKADFGLAFDKLGRKIYLWSKPKKP